MVAISASENDAGEFQNFSTVEALARELGAPIEEILVYYETALKELRPSARIKTYLPILASRQVREIVLEKKLGIEISGQRTASRA